jgi:GNAT superfamily N-acetyltransferase
LTLRLRALDLDSGDDLEWVAQGMRATLIEVEGKAIGVSLYSLDWLRERVRWHLGREDAAVWLALEGDAILGHSIVREESDGGCRHGLVSTSYVKPEARRKGIARALLRHDEAWMQARNLGESRTWTGAFNRPLIGLYESQGYRIVERVQHAATGTPMVCLARDLAAPGFSPAS